MMSVVCTAVSIALACFFFFNDTATTEIYTLSLHDALPIFRQFEFRNLLGRVDELDAAVPPADRPLEGLEVPWCETDQLPEASGEVGIALARGRAAVAVGDGTVLLTERLDSLTTSLRASEVAAQGAKTFRRAPGREGGG